MSAAEESKQVLTTGELGEGEQIPVKTKSKYKLDESVLNHELRRKLWEGLIPLKIDLDTNDLTSYEKPRSLYIMAPRENYFYYILNDVKQLFDAYGPPEKLEAYDEMWFEFNGTDLRWGLPIGVQFDTAVGLSQKTEEIPWQLTFHYKDNPNAQRRYFKGGLKTFHFTFINSLKESQCIRMGDANEILSGLAKKDEDRMINEGLFKNNYETFWEINQAHLLKHVADLKRYAIRVTTNTHHTFVQIDKKLKDKPLTAEGEPVSEDSQEFKDWQEEAYSLKIGDLLVEQFPNLFDNCLDDDTSELVVEPVTLPNDKKIEVLTHGLAVDLNTPVYWMQINLSYPDGFIYLSFHMPK